MATIQSIANIALAVIYPILLFYVLSIAKSQGEIRGKINELPNLKVLEDELGKIRHSFNEELERWKTNLSITSSIVGLNLNKSQKIYFSLIDIQVAVLDAGYAFSQKKSFNRSELADFIKEEQNKILKNFIFTGEKYSTKIIQAAWLLSEAIVFLDEKYDSKVFDKRMDDANIKKYEAVNILREEFNLGAVPKEIQMKFPPNKKIDLYKIPD